MNTLLELFLTFFKIGAFTFGGGYAMISLLDHECVEKREWITSDELMDIAIVAESTPGPIAINCATYTGYKRGGVLGAIIATFGMILPSLLIILLISQWLEGFMDVPVVIKIFRGVRVAVALLITQVAIRMIRKMVETSENKKIPIILTAGFFVLVFACNLTGVHVSTIYLIIVSGFIGFFLYSNPFKNQKGGR